MAKTYFTADLHLGHRLVSGLRGFPDPAEHDAAVADRWRARVGGDDVVWVLGDPAVTSSRRGIDEVLGKVADLPRTTAAVHMSCSTLSGITLTQQTPDGRPAREDFLYSFKAADLRLRASAGAPAHRLRSPAGEYPDKGGRMRQATEYEPETVNPGVASSQSANLRSLDPGLIIVGCSPQDRLHGCTAIGRG